MLKNVLKPLFSILFCHTSFRVTYFGAGVTVDGDEVFDPRGDRPRVGYSPFDVGDYFYAILGTIAVGIVVALFLYGFFIQPYFS